MTEQKIYQNRQKYFQLSTSSQMSLYKISFDTVRLEDFENFNVYLRLHRNARTKQFKIEHNVKTNFGMNSIGFGQQELEKFLKNVELLLSLTA